MMKHRKQYQSDGFCVIPRLVPPKSCKRVLKEMNAVFASQLATLGRKPAAFQDADDLYANMQKLFKLDTAIYLAAARHVTKLLSVQQLLFHENIVEAVASLGLVQPSVPTGPVVSIMSEKLKIEGGYFGLAPHQDWPSMQGSLDALIVWMPLTNITLEKFPLEVIPKSHLLGIWDGDNTASAREIRGDLYSSDDFLPIEASPGDVVLMTSFTVHRTGIAHRGRECSGLRIACNTRLENSAEKTFVSRHFPCAYKRSVERELLTKDFPSPTQVQNAILGKTG